jgi:ATP-dependent Clp protease ATP-binding subunit ClpC
MEDAVPPPERGQGSWRLGSPGARHTGVLFDRFTDPARRVVVLAQDEARRLNHDYIGPEHLLLGLIHEDKGVAARALQQCGIPLQAARAEVQQVIGRGDSPPGEPIPFTAEAKRALELSLREGFERGHRHIGTEHILLGVLGEGGGAAAQVLEQLGTDLDQVRDEVTELLSAI